MKDRGAIKWSAMMLPEHKKLLEKFYAEQEWVEKPILDEQKCEEINRVLLLAMGENKPVEIVFYREHNLQVVEGIITKYIPAEKRLKISHNLQRVYVELEQIVDANIL